MNFEKTPTKVEVETFWNSAWGPEKDYNEETEWLKRNEERCEEAFRKAQVWKLPVIDKVLFDLFMKTLKHSIHNVVLFVKTSKLSVVNSRLIHCLPFFLSGISAPLL